MRHHNTNKKFGREAKERGALVQSLVISLLTHGKITTTLARAKALRPSVEKMITRARDAQIPDRRILKSRLGNNEEMTKKLISEIAPKYKERKGGYTRITKLGLRSGKGDAAAMAVIEFV